MQNYFVLKTSLNRPIFYSVDSNSPNYTVCIVQRPWLRWAPFFSIYEALRKAVCLYFVSHDSCCEDMMQPWGSVFFVHHVLTLFSAAHHHRRSGDFVMLVGYEKRMDLREKRIEWANQKGRTHGLTWSRLRRRVTTNGLGWYEMSLEGETMQGYAISSTISATASWNYHHKVFELATPWRY